MAKLLFRLQLVAIGCIPDCPNPHPCSLSEGEGIFLSSRERRHGFAGTTHVNNVRLTGLWRNGHLSSLVWGLAYVGDGMTLGRFANRPYTRTYTLPRAPSS